MDFGENLKALRKQQNLTQADLSDKCDITQQSISYIEKGINSPTIYTAEKLAKALGVTLVDMLLYPSPMPVKTYDTVLTETERELISDYRQLNRQGRQIILQQMEMVKKIYEQSDSVSDMEIG